MSALPAQQSGCSTKVSLNSKVGFDIGWDHAQHYFRLHDDMHGYKDVLDGFNAAKDRKIAMETPDRFVAKWLLLRFNAWRRNRIFDDGVTPEFLRFIDVARCPITDVELTHGTQQETDWSVDRINNDAGYIKGNLIVVSRRANTLKLNYSFQEMAKFAYGNGFEPEKIFGFEPLSKIEWARWALVSSHAIFEVDSEGEMYLASLPAPCVILPPHGCLNNPSSCLQVAIAYKLYGVDDGGTYKHLCHVLPKTLRRMLHEIERRGEKIRSHGSEHLNIWFDPRLFCMFYTFYDQLSDDLISKLMRAFRKSGAISKRSVRVSTEASEWGAGTNGYISTNF